MQRTAVARGVGYPTCLPDAGVQLWSSRSSSSEYAYDPMKVPIGGMIISPWSVIAFIVYSYIRRWSFDPSVPIRGGLLASKALEIADRGSHILGIEAFPAAGRILE